MKNKFGVRTFWMVIGFLATVGAVSSVMAETPPLLCTASEAIACPKDGGECTRGPVDRVNLPLFFRVDPDAGVVHSLTEAGQRRTSPITTTTVENDFIVFLGKDMPTGWSMVVNKSTDEAHTVGKMTLSIAEPEAGYIVFGACIPEKPE